MPKCGIWRNFGVELGGFLVWNLAGFWCGIWRNFGVELGGILVSLAVSHGIHCGEKDW